MMIKLEPNLLSRLKELQYHFEYSRLLFSNFLLLILFCDLQKMDKHIHIVNEIFVLFLQVTHLPAQL